ncbi:serine hydrolase [Dyadobacter sp. CY356]|uniref:serine hydrolase domain-containing protein n=1 Tax=Dyadobacter sp. CY356 TaxID=2906442 RepID=UPI001F1DE1AF|nr:serine hydrolase domain-containing protein [Dyadobacter sp. CY356]
MQKQHIAGMMLSVVTRDSVLYCGGIHYANVKKREPVSAHHLFRQASITKQFVALGMLKLISNGKVTLQSRLKDIAPEIPFQNSWESVAPVTVEQLLEHSTGFADKSPFEEYNFSERTFPGITGIMIFEKFMICRWKPGQRHSYSGVNYAILAYLIEKLSGQTLDGYLRDNIFTPLGMQDANVDLAGKASGMYAQGYVWREGSYQPVAHQPQYNAGYGSLNASADDFAHALKAYLNEWKTGSGQFLSARILEQSETPDSYLSAKAGLKNTYGSGNEGYVFDGHIFRGHRGAIGGFLSAFLYDRHAGVGYAFSINTHNEEFYGYADALIRSFLIQHLPKSIPSRSYPVSAREIKPYAGYYRLSNPGQLYTGFLEAIQNTFRLDAAGGHLNLHMLLGGVMHFSQAGSSSLQFKNDNAYFAHAALLRNNENEPVFVDQTLYFTRVSAFQAWAPLVLFAGSVIFLLSSIVFGLVSLVLFYWKKWPLPLLLLRLSPAVAALCILVVVTTGLQLVERMKAGLPMDGARFLWIAGMSGFALFAVVTITLLIMNWRHLRPLILKTYLVLVFMSYVYLFVIFVSNHWYTIV